jgi:thiosulfate dehydrogenase
LPETQENEIRIRVTYIMNASKQEQAEKVLIYIARATAVLSLLFIFCCSILISTILWPDQRSSPLVSALQKPAKRAAAAFVGSPVISADAWKAPDESTIPAGSYGNMIRYGKDLVVHTAKYFGPNGSIAHISNGMNCQNCHLEGGTKIFGNNYAVFVANYPKKSNRSGEIQAASARIAECFDRSLAGSAPDASGKEVQSMLAYMKWLAAGVNKGDKVFGSSTEKLKYLDRAADPEHGLMLYRGQCKGCHGKNGEGLVAADKLSYVYPPLWGRHSYNDGAGMYRMSNFAGFVKNNMPFGVSYPDAQLTDEEAWDLAAYVNSQPRPHKEQQQDYPDLLVKPFDAPYGPYADNYPERQHKYGPFGPIVAAVRQTKLTAHSIPDTKDGRAYIRNIY